MRYIEAAVAERYTAALRARCIALECYIAARYIEELEARCNAVRLARRCANHFRN